MTGSFWTGARRAAATTLVFGVVCAVATVALYLARPALVLEMAGDADLPSEVASGFYPNERDASGLTFAWTGPVAGIRLNGIDRSVPWRLVVLMRGARPAPLSQPDVAFAIDGVTGIVHRASNEFQRVELVAPPREDGRRGLIVTLTSSHTFVPGPNDPRSLGIVVDRISLEPLAWFPLVPPKILMAATGAGLALGALAGLLQVGAVGTAALLLLLSLGQAAIVTRQLAPYVADTGWIASVACSTALVAWLASLAVRRVEGRPLAGATRFAVALTIIVLHVKLLLLLHPSMILGDSVAHVHRLWRVLRGELFFARGTPGGNFPYPIGLYLVAKPFASLVSNHVILLRSLVVGADAVAGLALYAMVARGARNSAAGVVALVLFHCAPVSLWVQTRAYLPNALSHSLSIVALALVAIGAVRVEKMVRFIGAMVIVLVALVTHEGSAAVLIATLTFAAALYWARGDPELRATAAGVALALVCSGVLAVGLYYGNVAARYRAEAGRSAAMLVSAAPSSPVSVPPLRLEPENTLWAPGWPALASRIAGVPGYAKWYFGWPLLLLAALGAARAGLGSGRDALTLLILAWLASCAVFLAFDLLTPFKLRVYYAAYPLLTILGGIAAGSAWAGGALSRVVVAALLAWAVAVGAASALASLA